MESLLAFIPEDRRLALARGESLPDRSVGSVLFADISGFTPLTAALAQELGIQRGAEEVLNQINPVYEAIIAELHRYGGSVMGFAGDAITCWLDGDDGYRGVACALAMQEAMRPFATVRTPAGTPISLAIKVAVTAGPARRFVVGDPGIQLIDVVAGRTLDHVASAEKEAEKGEVVIGEEIVQALGDIVQVAEWRDHGDERFAVVSGLTQLPEPCPHPPLDADALPETEAKSWALPPVYRRLQTGAKFLAELRPTVALFLRFTGIDYDNDEYAGEKLDAFVRWLQTVVQKQEGFLIQLTIGDKGSYAYASFGAPLAHDDDAERAVAAAMELRNIPPLLNFIGELQIGISRGRVWAGECGARVRHTYGVMGNEVNMAARLMAKANPGQVLVRRRVADEAKRNFNFRQLGMITVKGGAEPIPIAELLGRQQAQDGQRSQFELPLVGRETELAQLERMLDGVLAGRGRIITIQGPTGVGKSHLAAIFQQRAAANGFQVAAGASQRIFQSTTYYTWQQMLRQLLGLHTVQPAEQSAEEFARAQIRTVEWTLKQINSNWGVRIPLLGDLLGLAIPDNPTTAAFDARQRQETLVAFVVEIIRTWAHAQPLMLVVDNAQWIDESSQALTEALAKAIADVPVALLVIARPAAETESDTEALDSVRKVRHHALVHLGELSTSGIELLVENLLGGRVSLLGRLLIQAKAQGSPFFTRELVDALHESGQLIREDGEWVLSPGMIDALRAANALVRENNTWVLADSADLSAISLGIPDSVHGVILARLDRLPDSHKPTIKVASVIGYTFELGLLAQVHPARLAEQALQKQAQVLEERDFIFHDFAESDSNGEAYTFRQQATQEVSYETLLFTQRRELHRNLGEILEQQAPDTIDQIAYHAYLGEDWERALRYQLQAGVRGKQLFANLQSIEHYRKALHSSRRLPAEGTLPQRQQIHADLGELLLTVGQHDEAMEHLQAALQLAQEIGEVEMQAGACRWIARAYELGGEYEPALEWIDRGLAILADRLTPSALELRLTAALIYNRQGDYKTAHEQALASLLAADEIGEKSIVARAHNVLGLIDRLRGRANGAAVHFEESLTLYREIGNLQGQALAQNSLANVYFDLGQWSEADQFYRQAGQTFSQLGDVYNRLFVDNNQGGIALNQGRLEDALKYYQRAIRAIEQIGGSRYVLAALYSNLGATYVKQGEITTACIHLQRSKDLFEEAGVRDDLVCELLRRFAEAYLKEERLELAAGEAEASLSLAKEIMNPREEGNTLRVLGEIALASGHYERAEELAERASKLLEEASDVYGLSQAQMLLARLQAIQGEYEKSAHNLAQCEPLLEKLDAKIDLETLRSLRATLV